MYDAGNDASSGDRSNGTVDTRQPQGAPQRTTGTTTRDFDLHLAGEEPADALVDPLPLHRGGDDDEIRLNTGLVTETGQHQD